jgi:hypothetical protein
VADVYTIGLFAGLGASLGLALAGFLAASRAGAVAAAILAAVAAAVLALLLADLDELLGGTAGALLGAAGAGPLIVGTLRRGGTRAGTSLIVGLAALAGAVLAFVPLVGYLEAVALPVLAARLRNRAGERYAGLRTLARDEP